MRDNIPLILDRDPKILGIQVLSAYNKVLEYIFYQEDFGSSNKTLFQLEGTWCTVFEREIRKTIQKFSVIL